MDTDIFVQRYNYYLSHSYQDYVCFFDCQSQIKTKGIIMSMSHKEILSDKTCIQLGYPYEIRIQRKIGYQSPIDYRKSVVYFITVSQF